MNTNTAAIAFLQGYMSKQAGTFCEDDGKDVPSDCVFEQDPITRFLMEYKNTNDSKSYNFKLSKNAYTKPL